MKEYRTKARFLGLPLIHMASRSHRSERPVGVARGWIAVGDRAMGGLVALGNVALAPIAIGGLAVGVVSSSLVAVGGFAAGVIAIGAWAWGGVALGLDAAAGGIVAASRFADGIIAWGGHANDPVSDEFFRSALPYVLLERFLDRRTLVVAATLLLLIPVIFLRLRRDE